MKEDVVRANGSKSAPDVKVGAATEVLQAQEALRLVQLHARKDSRLPQNGARRVYLPQLHHLQHHLRPEEGNYIYQYLPLSTLPAPPVLQGLLVGE